jgi:hypothetical protein
VNLPLKVTRYNHLAANEAQSPGAASDD